MVRPTGTADSSCLHANTQHSARSKHRVCTTTVTGAFHQAMEGKAQPYYSRLAMSFNSFRHTDVWRRLLSARLMLELFVSLRCNGSWSTKTQLFCHRSNGWWKPAHGGDRQWPKHTMVLSNTIQHSDGWLKFDWNPVNPLGIKIRPRHPELSCDSNWEGHACANTKAARGCTNNKHESLAKSMHSAVNSATIWWTNWWTYRQELCCAST